MAIRFYNTELQQYADQGLNYFRSNSNLGIEDNIHKNKPVRDAREVLDELGY